MRIDELIEKEGQDSEFLEEISKELLRSNKIGIIYHASPDGDAVGALAL